MMNTISEYTRYLVATAMLFIGLLGLILGDAWVWLGLATFVALALADVLVGSDVVLHDQAPKWLYDGVLYLQLPLMLGLWILLGLHVRHESLSTFNLLGAIISVGFLSALAGLPAAHELMHRKHPVEIFYSSLYLTLFGLPLNDLYHVHGHHPNVGTLSDSDTPRRGQTVYDFTLRSLSHGFLVAARLEMTRLKKLRLPLWSPRSRVMWGALSLAVWIGTFLFVAGPWGVPVLLVSWFMCFLIISGFNYTQHYGLVRQPGTPLLPHHSWNHLKTLSRAVSFEISNHSEHHLDPDKAYERLVAYPQAPQMPSIVMCFLASFVPRLWEEVIAKPRLKHWDLHYASEAERELARKANQIAGWPDWQDGMQSKAQPA